MGNSIGGNSKVKKIYGILILIVIVVFSVSLILLFMKREAVQNVSKNNIENVNNTNEYDEVTNNIAVSEMNNKQEAILVSIVESGNEENIINITDKDIKLIETLNPTEENPQEMAIESKIYARAAQKMGITLPQDEVEEIEKISSSDEILGYIEGNDMAQDKLKERIRNYLTENSYYKELKDKILEEVTINKISIENEMIKSKTKEYHDVQKNFEKIENPTEEDKQNCLSKTLSLYYEIEELYLKAIKDKYIVDMK